MSFRLLELDCNEFLPNFVSFLWVSLILSCIGAVIIPEVRSWHRYGKLRGREETEKGTRSFLDKLTVPKQLFCLFYIEGMIWGAILLFRRTYLIVNVLENTVCKPNSAQQLFLGEFHSLPLVLFILQCIRRLEEEYFAPPSSARMHIAGFAVGAMFYALVPLSLLEIRDNKGKLLQISLNPSLVLLLIGVLIFIWGSIHQTKCHTILHEMKFASDRYGLPTGDWFKYSSSPHYLAEIVIYFGLFLIGLSLSLDDHSFPRNLLLCLLFTICNLSITAQRTHDWYLQKFKEDYSRLNRWRIIPFVY